MDDETVTIREEKAIREFHPGRLIVGALAYLGLAFFVCIALLMLLVYGLMLIWRAAFG